jgi:hypothetical protein
MGTSIYMGNPITKYFKNGIREYKKCCESSDVSRTGYNNEMVKLSHLPDY